MPRWTTAQLRVAASTMKITRQLTLLAAGLFLLTGQIDAAEQPADNSRKPTNDRELRYWLENMVWHHGYTLSEISAATGLNEEDISKSLRKFEISAATKPRRKPGAPLLTLPYPGGRHPRIGFLEGAIRPQRETKISVFTPWDDKSYVVVDVPEAIWSNLGLTYLAHTHIDTVWTKQGIKLPPLEWHRREDGTFDIVRTLPNKISFGAKVMPGREGVKMSLWLKNGTDKTLTDLRVQNCVMLKGAAGFAEQTNDNKVLSKPFCAARNAAVNRWIITAWDHCHRPWANDRCPCLHSDPKFPDCAPGEKKTLHGWLSFYEGTDIEAEFARLRKMDWLAHKNKKSTGQGKQAQ